MSVTAKRLADAAYLSNAAAQLYVAPASTNVIIDKMTVTNTDSGARTVTVYIVPSGGSSGGSNTIISAFSLSAGLSQDLTQMQNQILAPGDSIWALADNASKVVARISGREIV